MSRDMTHLLGFSRLCDSEAKAFKPKREYIDIDMFEEYT